jgi:Tol biopolymer transport system component
MTARSIALVPVFLLLAAVLSGATPTLDIASRAPLASPLQNSGGLISADGRFVAYTSFSGFFLDLAGSHGDVVLLRDRTQMTAQLVTRAWDGGPANGDSEALAISADGGWVLFQSRANDLVPWDANDVTTATTERVWLWRRATGGFNLLAVGHGPGALSDDGRIAAFVTSVDSRILISDGTGVVALPYIVDGSMPTGPMSLSGDGDVLAFTSHDPFRPDDGPTDVVVYRRSTGMLTVASQRADNVLGNASSWWPSLSRDGRELAFVSAASNLVPDDTDGHVDVVVRNLVTGHLGLVGVGNGDTSEAMLSRDGCYVAFVSRASNLVPGDTNGVADVFVKDLVHGGVARRSLTSTGAQSPEAARGVGIAVFRGQATVVFTSRLLTPGLADNLNFDFDVMDNVYTSTAPAPLSPILQMLQLAAALPLANG